MPADETIEDKANDILHRLLSIPEGRPLPFAFNEVPDRGELPTLKARISIGGNVKPSENAVDAETIRRRVRGALVEIARFAIDMWAKLGEGDDEQPV